MAEKQVKPKVNFETPPIEENQTLEAVEETYFFHSIQISDGNEVLSEEQIEKSKVEIEQKLQELLNTISEETLQLSEFLMEEKNRTRNLHIPQAYFEKA